MYSIRLKYQSQLIKCLVKVIFAKMNKIKDIDKIKYNEFCKFCKDLYINLT